MAEKQAITSNFYMQLLTIGSIGLSSIFGFRYMVSEMKDAARDEIKPIVERVIILEEACKSHGILIADNTEQLNAVSVSLNNFLDYYTRMYHKEFLRPADVTQTEYYKRKHR